MSLSLKEKIRDRQGLHDILDDIAGRILKEPFDFEKLAFVGILTGGAGFAKYLATRVSQAKGITVPVAFCDIALYRDDMIDTQFDPYSRAAEIPFALKNREVVLVDDVLFTGRTVRAALTSILSIGRPRLIRLAVLVDRGFRELPIAPDFVGLSIETTRQQGVRVRDFETPDPGIFIYQAK